MSKHIYQPTDLVLAKVKGFAAWPAMILPNEIIPDHVLKNRVKATRSTGRARGRRSAASEVEQEVVEVDNDIDDLSANDNDPDNFIVYSNILKFRKNSELKQNYCVKFLCDDSYIWVKPSDIQLLPIKECKDWLKNANKNRVSKKLIPAYEMASRGPEGIDVWEFVEYGSEGKPDEEEYVEEEQEEQVSNEEDEEYKGDIGSKIRRRPSRTVKKPTRTSTRQTEKRKRDAEKPSKRSTRSKKSKIEPKEEKIDDERFDKVIETNSRKSTSKVGKNKITAKINSKIKTPTIEKYNYEDDEDWNIIGLGPQDLNIQKHANKLVNKLVQKKSQERHNETRLDIIDKIAGINRLLIDLIIPDPENVSKGCSNVKVDYEVIIDELDIALQYNGNNDEYITLFQSNNELLINFRLLINLRHEQLSNWKILDNFQNLFRGIFRSEIVPDGGEWSLEENVPELVAQEVEAAN